MAERPIEAGGFVAQQQVGQAEIGFGLSPFEPLLAVWVGGHPVSTFQRHQSGLRFAAFQMPMPHTGPELPFVRQSRLSAVIVLEVLPAVPRLETPPLVVGARILFPRGEILLGMPVDRISSVAARANAEFSTTPFTMPAADLLLNAALPSPERPFARDSAYLMVAVLDEQGTVSPLSRRTNASLQNEDHYDILLRWDNRSARELAFHRPAACAAGSRRE